MIILVLTHHIEGGTGTYLYEFLKLKKKIKRLDIKIAVLKKNFFTVINRDFKRYRSEYISNKDNCDNNFSLLSVILFPVEFFSLYNLVKKIRPDIVLSIDSHCSILAACLKYTYFKNINVVVTIHNNIDAILAKKILLFRYLFQYFGSILFKRDDKIIGVSYGVSKSFYQFFSLKKHVETIHCGININKSISLSNQSLPLREKLLFMGNELKIISVGRLEDQKDFFTLIKAFSLCYKKEKKIKLFILGDGKNRRKIEELIYSLQLQRKIYLLGWKDNVFPYLKLSDIFINSSLYEGFPYVILEAITQKLPIISTDSPYGPREILHDGKYGILTPIGNSLSMAKKIIRFLEDKKLRNKYQIFSAQRILYFSSEKMITKYEKIFMQCLRNKV